MARPKRNNADYFSHDNNMRNDPKIKALRKKFDHNLGYTVYNMLIEVLTEADFFSITLDDLTIELLAGDFDVDSALVTEIINYCVYIKLLIREENTIFSEGLKKRLQPVIDSRNRVKTYKEQNKLTKGRVSTVETPQSKVKESKVNKTKDINENINIYSGADAVEAVIENYFDAGTENETVYQDPDLLNEEEYSEAVKFLRRHSVFALVQKNNGKREDEVLRLFRIFFEQKTSFKELKNKKPDEVMKNFYYWVPKYLLSNPVSKDSQKSILQQNIESAQRRQAKYN